MMLAQQVPERLVRELLKARHAVAREHVERGPGLRVEFHELAARGLLLPGCFRSHGNALPQLAAMTLILLSAISVSFLSVAFSSCSVCSRIFAQSLRPSCFAQAISAPYRVIS